MRTPTPLHLRRWVLMVTAGALLTLAGVAVANPPATNIHLGQTSFGPFVAPRLQNGHQYPIYISTGDGRDKSHCFGSCTSTFKLVTTFGKIKAWNGVRRKLLGSISRGHGVKQVTYNHHPLYTAPSDTPGTAGLDGCSRYGSDWYVIGRNGIPDERWTCNFY